jgi:hypothetical protein
MQPLNFTRLLSGGTDNPLWTNRFVSFNNGINGSWRDYANSVEHKEMMMNCFVRVAWISTFAKRP